MRCVGVDMMIRSTLVLLITATILHSYAEQHLMQSTCNKTPDFQACLNILRADNRSATANVWGLAQVVLDAVKYRAEDASSTLNNLKGSVQEPKQSKALEHCSQAFQAMLQSDIPKTRQGLQQRNLRFVQNGMANVKAGVNDCYANMEISGLGLAQKIVSLVISAVKGGIEILVAIIQAIAAVLPP